MTDLVGIFNAESRKTVSKFTGLRWFHLFDDLQNREGPLQANSTRKKTSEFKWVKLKISASVTEGHQYT